MILTYKYFEEFYTRIGDDGIDEKKPSHFVLERVYVNNVPYGDRYVSRNDMSYMWHLIPHHTASFQEDDVELMVGDGTLVPITKCKAKKLLDKKTWPLNTDSQRWIEPNHEQAQAS